MLSHIFFMSKLVGTNLFLYLCTVFYTVRTVSSRQAREMCSEWNSEN